jgi:molecular chaperone GrpE
VIERHGIKRVDPLGEKFDYNFHQAMFEVPTEDQVSGVVLEVVQHGYVLHDRLLRPAMVGVSKASDATSNKHD